MDKDPLRLDLAGPVDEAGPVDTWAPRTAQRLRLRRAIATSGLAAVLVGVATGVAFALIPRPAPLPLDSAVMAEPSPTTGATPRPSPSVEPGSRVGTRYYLDLTERAVTVHAVRNGTVDAVVRVPLAGNPCAANSISVSPDGRRLAWVRGGDATGTGTLVAADIDGSNQRTLAVGINCLGSTALVWQGGDRLVVRGRMGAFLRVDVASGRRVDGDLGQVTDVCWSPDGRWLAAVAEGRPYLTGPGGTRSYHYTPPQPEAQRYNGWSARSVSPDGRYVAVGWKDTQPIRMDSSFAVVDTTTGTLVALPVDGAVSSIHFTPDRRVLVRTPDRITVLDSRFRVTDQVAELAAVRQMRLLGYAPQT